MSKPKLCEILGMEIDEEFVYQYRFYSIDELGRLWMKQGYTWNVVNIPAELIEHPEKIRKLAPRLQENSGGSDDSKDWTGNSRVDVFLSLHKIEEEPEEEPELTPEEAEFKAYRESIEKQLKPCPFCGSNDIHIIDSYPHYPFCLGCGAEIRRTPYAFAEDGVRQAMERWNRRADDNQEV